MKIRHSRPTNKTLRVPAMLAALTIAGLIFGLVGDGFYDVLSWLALTIPVAIVAWAWSPKR